LLLSRFENVFRRVLKSYLLTWDSVIARRKLAMLQLACLRSTFLLYGSKKENSSYLVSISKSL
jgi:hypothetical protein